jgi:hypothetical protein
MKDAIIAAIKAKYPTINLSKSRLNALATRIEGKVAGDEAKIDETIATYEDYITDIAKADDAIRTLEAKAKEKPEPKKEDPDPKPEETPKDDIAAMLRSLTEKVTALTTEKQQTTIKSKVAEKLKEVPPIVWSKRAFPDKEEDIDAFVTEVTGEYAEYEKSSNNTQLGFLGKPKSGGGSGGSEKKASQAEIDALVGNLLPAKQNLS